MEPDDIISTPTPRPQSCQSQSRPVRQPVSRQLVLFQYELPTVAHSFPPPWRRIGRRRARPESAIRAVGPSSSERECPMFADPWANTARHYARHPNTPKQIQANPRLALPGTKFYLLNLPNSCTSFHPEYEYKLERCPYGALLAAKVQ